ncbi:MAG: hypothetical protein U0359_24975 [Byssovorax sp.]
MHTKMHLRTLGLLAGALLLSTVGCELVATVDRSKAGETTGTGGGAATTTTGTGGTAGAGGTGGMAGMGGTGGAGGKPECAVAQDCPDTGNECVARACTDGKCVPEPVASGTPLAQQKAGDCQKAICDGNGGKTTEADNADKPVDGNACTDDMCTAGVPSNPAVAADTACGQGGMLYCDGAGKCVGCTKDDQCGVKTDCSIPHCALGACSIELVAPGTPVPGQTAGDCQVTQCDGIGGTKQVNDDTDTADDGNECTDDLCVAGMLTHPSSASGKACTANDGQRCDGAGACVECLSGADCASFVCTLHACAAPTCTDNVKNATETDIDCGGAGCAPCVDGKACGVAADCTSSVCSGTPLVCQVPACNDSAKNGSETDVDCGGMCAKKCGPGKGCSGNGDCVGGTCTANVCAPTCTDQVMNGTESDVDCGGSCAVKCGPNKACNGDADCAGGSCVANVCVPTCTDQVKNGAETDTDCGGGACPACANGKTCSINSDCANNNCAGGFCAASCTDGIKNGSETDVDCGGATCGPCADGKLCSGNSDCANNNCTAGKCAVDNEPTNNTCAGASAEPIPANITGLSLPNVNDVDWFVFTAAAGDVGKVVHVVTTSTGSPPCDTVVEVFQGSCGSLVSLGGPSDDADYSENWLSDPLTSAGSFWVKVSYSSFGFSSAPYTLIVTLQ